MSSKTRLGIYGGTFSPPHLGHVGAAESFYGAVPLDKLLIIPDFLPPHKEISGFVNADDRLEMTRLAFSDFPVAKVSDMEIRRGGRSYTAITLSELKREDNELYFLCGTDMFLSLDSWYRPDLIFSLASICYVRRENDPQNDQRIEELTAYYKNKYNAKIIPIFSDVTEISSTELREKIINDEDVSTLIPKKANEYIKAKRLYK